MILFRVHHGFHHAFFCPEIPRSIPWCIQLLLLSPLQSLTAAGSLLAHLSRPWHPRRVLPNPLGSPRWSHAIRPRVRTLGKRAKEMMSPSQCINSGVQGTDPDSTPCRWHLPVLQIPSRRCFEITHTLLLVTGHSLMLASGRASSTVRDSKTRSPYGCSGPVGTSLVVLVNSH